MSESTSHSRCFRYRAHPSLQVERREHLCNGQEALQRLTTQLDSVRGMRLTCVMEYPGRYRKRDMGFINPPLLITSSAQQLTVQALNKRGEILLPAIQSVLKPHVQQLSLRGDRLICEARPQSAHDVIEEQRSKTAGVVPLLRQLLALFQHPDESRLGLYGAFAYDMAFQFDDIEKQLERHDHQKDMQFYLPDEILQVDPLTGQGYLYQYEFIATDEDGRVETTGGLRRQTAPQKAAIKETGSQSKGEPNNDHTAAEYQDVVRSALSEIAKGNLFEVVPSRTFSQPLRTQPSLVYQTLLNENPSPYAALINFGDGEYLISASPEMFVRVAGKRVESCPISGTIKRGKTPVEDAEQIKRLMNSHKDEVELTMCTDVDRNDKNRVCEAGTVKLLGRRQIEMYSRLIHTVDHVEGRLRDDLNGLDALLSHCWAVTVTGAPKRAAMTFIEQHEKNTRDWYGGCFGFMAANGDIDTGLTIRSAHVKNGRVNVRAGATLLAHSCPEEEEAETRLKASALLSALQPEQAGDASCLRNVEPGDSCQLRQDVRQNESIVPQKVLVVDHEDSFIHSLSAAFRAAGLAVETRRPASAREALLRQEYDLVVMSPGPGTPEDFACHETLALCEQVGVAVFGVCLGMQAMVSYCGGSLSVLPRPVHGASSQVCHQGDSLFDGIESVFHAGRYHSLIASRVPDMLEVTSRTLADGIAMSVRHRALPWTAVQFHPESILSGSSDIVADGNAFVQKMVINLLRSLQVQTGPTSRQGREGNLSRSDAIRRGAA